MDKLDNILVIANPESGRSESKEKEEYLRVKLSEYFNYVDVRYTKEKGHATELVKQAVEEGFTSICSVGGDGTIAEILQGLIEFDNPPTLLIYPAGTGNILSQALGYSQNPKKVIDQLDYKNPKKIDIGLVNGKAFSFLLSIGNISESVHEVSNEDKEKFGFFAYVSNIFKNMGNDKQYNLSIELDGQKYEGNVDHLAVTMSEKLGPVKVSKLDASCDDGMMNLFILNDKSSWTKARVGIEAFFGDVQNSDAVEFMRGKKLTIKNLNDDQVQIDIDGDQGPDLPINVEVISDKIKVFVPKK